MTDSYDRNREFFKLKELFEATGYKESKAYQSKLEKNEFQPHYPPIGNPKLIELLKF